MKHSTYSRVAIYLLGLIILAFGITLNVKTGLGVSPIVSVAAAASEITGTAIGDATFVLYTLFVIIEIFIHLFMFREGRVEKFRVTLLKDVLQLPLSLLFTRVMNIFSAYIPLLPDLPAESFFSSYAARFITLFLAIAATGVGASFSLNMRIVPNPGDGIVQTIADAAGKGTGLVKNLFDGVNVLVSIAISLIFTSRIGVVGIGTVIAFLGVGRVVALTNHLLGDGGNRTL